MIFCNVANFKEWFICITIIVFKLPATHILDKINNKSTY